MSAKPRFKPMVGWAVQTPHDGGFFATESKDGAEGEIRVCVTDARDLTPEKAVEKVLQKLRDFHEEMWVIKELAKAAGMSARVVNGKVRVRRVER